MRVLMPLLRSLTWMRIYCRKALLAHRPMIMIVFGYTLARYSSMKNPERMEWVPNYLCVNPSISSPKESVPDLSDLVVIWEMIFVFWSSTQTVFTSVSRVVPDYESSLMKIYAHIRTGQRVVAVRHYTFNPVFMCAECRGNLIRQMEDPIVLGNFAAFSVKTSPFWRIRVHLSSPLGVAEYS